MGSASSPVGARGGKERLTCSATTASTVWSHHLESVDAVGGMASEPPGTRGAGTTVADPRSDDGVALA